MLAPMAGLKEKTLKTVVLDGNPLEATLNPEQ